MTPHDVRFRTARPITVVSQRLTPVPLAAEHPSRHVRGADGGVAFVIPGWYEVLLRVDWDDAYTDGTRFSHTKVPGQQPLHSEAIDAGVLAHCHEASVVRAEPAKARSNGIGEQWYPQTGVLA